MSLKQSNKWCGPVVTVYEILDHGIEGSQYFQGCGTAHTSYENVVTGIGDTFAEAIDDCLESIAQNGVNIVSLERRIKKEYGESLPCSVSASALYPSEDSEMYYHVSIRYTVKDRYSVVHHDSRMTTEQWMIRKDVVSIREAKNLASYYSISAPPRITKVIKATTGQLVAKYYNGSPMKGSK